MNKLFSSVQLLSHVQLFATPWTAARQASLSITNSWSSPKFMSTESVMPSSHLTFCRPLLLLPSIPPSIRVFSNESALHIRWPKYWSFGFSISPSSERPGLISLRMDVSDRLAGCSASPVLRERQIKPKVAPLTPVGVSRETDGLWSDTCSWPLAYLPWGRKKWAAG